MQIIAMFLLVQFSGLLLATQVFTGVTYQQVQSAQVVSSSFDILFYIAYIVVVSVVLVLIFRIYKGEKLFLLLEGAVVFVSSLIVFLVVISSLQGSAFNNLLGNGSVADFIGAAILAGALIALKYKIPRLRNTTAIISSIGVGLVLGISFGFYIALAFMVVLAAYDFIAVFITKHMIALGNMAIEKNLSFLIMVDEVEAFPLSRLDAGQRKEYASAMPAAKPQRGSVAESLSGKKMVPVTARTALGTGDLAIPLMVAVSAYRLNLNFVLSFVVILGALFGLILTMSILRKYKRALPAIPPLLFGIAVALLLYMIAVHL